MESNDGSSALMLSHIDFEPYCKWRRNEKKRNVLGKEEERDILEVHLHGFKREQLKASINRFGTSLKISGESKIDEKTSRRFCKEIEIPKYYNAKEIRAKFSGGVLSLTMPKKVPLLKQALDKLGPKGSFWKMRVDIETVVKVTAVTLGLALGAYLTFYVSP